MRGRGREEREGEGMVGKSLSPGNLRKFDH